MFDLSPPTQSCVTTGPWSEKWGCCTTWTDAVHPAKKASTIAVWERYVKVEAGRWIVEIEILHWCHMKILCGKKSRWAAETMYSRRCEKKGWYWAHVTNRLWLISWQLFVHHVTTILILESWVWNGDLANRIVLKRSVFTASLPTPPRTYRRCERGCSHGNYDSQGADLGNQGSSTDEEDT